MSEEKYIYESPDGGHSIYRRVIGRREPRELISVSPELQAKQEVEQLWLKWMPILRDSQNDPVLREMLDRAMVYHSLKDSP